MKNLPGQVQIFLSGKGQQVPNQLSVKGTGMGAAAEYPADVQEKNLRLFRRFHVYHQRLAWRAGIGLGENLARQDAVQHRGISPDIIMFDQDLSLQYHSQGSSRVTGPVNHFPFFIGLRFRCQAGEHRFHLFRLYAAEQSCPGQKLIIHLKIFSFLLS